jgi:hypothetical protein
MVRERMMRKAGRSVLAVLAGLLLASSGLAQVKQVKHERRPPASAESGSAAFPSTPTQPNYEYFSILDGLPMGLELHHDTQVGTGTAVDVYMFPIELQVMNSDGNLEPAGLIIDNFYTAKAVDPGTAPNPHNARDCNTWNTLVSNEIKSRAPNSPTWSYVEFTVAEGARVIETNEDGRVFWSDDIECWGSRDRFPPF